MSGWLMLWIGMLIVGALILVVAADYEDFEINIGWRGGIFSLLAIIACVVGFQGMFAWMVVWML